MCRGRRDQALRRLVVPWAARRIVRPRQAERRPAAGNPPPPLSLRVPPGSTGRLPQLAELPHPHRVTPRGGKRHRIRAWDLAVRSPDSSCEILRAIGVDQHLRTSAPCHTVRLAWTARTDFPARKLPLKLAPTLTVPTGSLSVHAQHAYPGYVSHRQTHHGSFSPTPEHDDPPAAADRGVLAEASRNSSGSSTRRARAGRGSFGSAAVLVRSYGGSGVRSW
jgi:hypothetical protein